MAIKAIVAQIVYKSLLIVSLSHVLVILDGQILEPYFSAIYFLIGILEN